MAQKQLTFDTDAREAVLAGVEKLAQAVVSTLGPKGRCAVLDKSWGGPLITKDGVTVARDIELADKNENLGAQLVKEAASKTNDRAGDGTTTATLLAWSIYKNSLRHLTVGADQQAMIRGMRLAADEVQAFLKKNATPVSSNKDIKAIATIAANNDPEIGKILADAFQEVGNDGVITIEEGKSLKTEVQTVKGMQFDRGFLSAHFANDNEGLECSMESPLILVYEDKISSIQSLLPLLEAAKEANKPLILIAEDIDGEALATLVVNKLRGILDVTATKAPGYGDRRKEMLRDIATVTNAQPIMKDDGIELEKVTLDMLGTAQKVILDANTTTIVKGAGKAKDIEARANLLRRQIEVTTSDYDKEKMEERLAKLVGGIAQVQVGGASETEVKERKHRFEDAKHATTAAIEEGILPGGGVALLRASDAVSKKLKLAGDENTGANILYSALTSPLRTIAENAGEDGSVVARRVRKEKSFSFGYDALRNDYGDMIELGVMDPLKVTRTALENAIAVASTLMSTDCLIVEADSKDGVKSNSDSNFEGDF
ncbi:MAG: chaperonin GroEL [Planctomycetes bacterium]|nr:chaperonin GroEL [Planctomycetota bacterium]